MKKQYNYKEAPELAIIKKEVEDYLDIEDIGVSLRTTEYALARWLYMKLAKEFTNYSTMVIASAVRRDHSTVVHALQSFDFEVMYNKSLQAKYDELVIIIIDKLQTDSLKTIETKITKLTNQLAILNMRRTKLIENAITYTKQQNQENITALKSAFV